MKLGIMQPYFLPYIGYWQLLNAVDKYVVYDDVTFIKEGWINRNRILQNGTAAYFNVPMLGASSFKRINEIEVNPDSRVKRKVIKTIEQNYSKAPLFKTVMPLVESIFSSEEGNLARFLIRSIQVVCNYLDIHTEILISSELDKNNDLKGQDKILDICKRLEATEYYNAIGGKELYDKASFARNGIELHFLDTGKVSYSQGKREFIPNLSILDVMMFNELSIVKKFLTDYKLI